jgi:hypothetical protein
VVWAAFDGPHAPNAVDGSADPYAPGDRSWTQAVVWGFFTQFGSDSPGPTPTPTPTTTPGTGQQLVGAQSGRCVTAPNQSAGSQLQLQDCARQSTQLWTVTSGRQLQLPGNLCLDASGQGTSNGTAAIIWACNGQANQQWNINSNGTISGAQSGLCLDAFGAGTANGTNIILWSCHGGSNQQWALRG